MTALNYVFDGTRDNFRELVIGNSHKGAVLVNYWTPNAGPCFKLWQVLESLSQEYRGRFLLVNVNTEAQPALARENAITSVPTVKIYRQGNIVESIYGAQSEAGLRKVIDRHVAPAQDTPLADAIRRYQAGDADGAIQLLVQASLETPDDSRLHATTLKLLLREKRYADIETYAAALPEALRAQPDINALRVHAKMLDLAQQAPPAEQLDRELEDMPQDKDRMLSRAALAMVQDDYATALEQLLKLLSADRYYADDLPRRAMLAMFALLGDQHELTRRYQRALRDVLH